MRNKFLASFVILILIDQITKAIFSHRDFFFAGMHFRLVQNFGLSFGLNFGGVLNLAIILLALLVFVYFIFKGNFSGINNSAVTLVAAGAIANLIDRLAYGYVRDFWDIGLGFTFNLADIFIFLGIIIILFSNNSQAG